MSAESPPRYPQVGKTVEGDEIEGVEASPYDGDQAQEDMEANQQDQEEVEAQIEDAHGGQSPPQRITRSMFKALGARGHLFSLFVISLVEGA